MHGAFYLEQNEILNILINWVMQLARHECTVVLHNTIYSFTGRKIFARRCTHLDQSILGLKLTCNLLLQMNLTQRFS
jgi:hypothetical protein